MFKNFFKTRIQLTNHSRRKSMNAPRLFSSTVLFFALFLTTSGLILPGDSVPGIDISLEQFLAFTKPNPIIIIFRIEISLEQIPGGIVKTVKTDKEGRFKFENLKPGKYMVNLASKNIENLNSSRSNITLPISPRGTTHCDITITLIETGKKKPLEPIEVTIGPKGGKITGQLELEVAIKEKGVKS